MNQRIPGPEDEALEVLLDAIETVDYMACRALTAANAGDMEAVKRKLHILRFLIRHNVIGLLGIKDGEDDE
ncbi:MAG: hypothetical protein HXK27_04235 [Atopobium sp.]|nr:hypothetical protein [Atopobium sp.]